MQPPRAASSPEIWPPSAASSSAGRGGYLSGVALQPRPDVGGRHGAGGLREGVPRAAHVSRRVGVLDLADGDCDERVPIVAPRSRAAAGRCRPDALHR